MPIRTLIPRFAHPATARCAVLVAAATLLAACTMPVHTEATAQPPDPFNPAATQLLDNTQWNLTGWQHKDGNARTVPSTSAGGQPVTLELSTSTGQRLASGFSGCNRFTGTYTLKNGLLSFGPLASTRMACVGAGAEIEDAYLDALAHIARTGVQWREPRQLLLVLENGDRLTFAYRNP